MGTAAYGPELFAQSQMTLTFIVESWDKHQSFFLDSPLYLIVLRTL